MFLVIKQIKYNQKFSFSTGKDKFASSLEFLGLSKQLTT